MAIENAARPSEATVAIFLDWWEQLMREEATGRARADRSVLRRAPDLTAVACTSAYQRLYQRVRAANGTDWPEFRNDRFAAAVALAVHVDGSSIRLSVPESMSVSLKAGDPRDGDNPVSELRFRRLLDAPDIDALFLGLRRVMPLIANRVSPKSLLLDVFDWGDRTRKRWAYAYAWPDKPSN